LSGTGAGRAKLEASESGGSPEDPLLRGASRATRFRPYLSAIDVAKLASERGPAGSFRYTTKLSEYLCLSLPVVTNAIPLSYDLPGEWFFRLGWHFALDPLFIDQLAELMKNLTLADIEHKRNQTQEAAPLFNLERQLERFSAFVRLAAQINLSLDHLLRSGCRTLGRGS